MASVVGICNRALQKLGATRILALTDNLREARSVNAAYDPVRLALLRRYYWNFAKKRAQLASMVGAPAFDYSYAFPLPADCLRVILPQDPYCDWNIEGRALLTNNGSVVNLRYICDVSDPNQFDAQFAECLAHKLAIEICDELTQTVTKKEGLLTEWKSVIAEAAIANSMENPPHDPPEDSWITDRYGGAGGIDNTTIGGLR